MADFIRIHPGDNVAVALKAILTPTNAEWSPAQLCQELKQEREAVLKGGTADHKGE